MRGQPGEPEALAREVLALAPRERSARIAEARVICALTAAGPEWDMDVVRPELSAALAELAEQAGDSLAVHPMAGMAEPMLALFDRDPDRALAIMGRYEASPDPWIRAAAPLQRGAFYAMVGRLAEAEADCRAALAAFRAIGEPWGQAAALIQTADFVAMQADYPAAVGLLEEAASLGEDVGAWGDLAYLAGKLAAVRLRTGDLAGARADLERAEQEAGQHAGVSSDSAAWLSLVRAELHVLEGDSAAAARQCENVLSWLESRQSVWWQGFRALTCARLALIVAAEDEERGRALLATALRDASEWVERPPLAGVIDAIAAFALRRRLPAGRPSPATPGPRPRCSAAPIPSGAPTTKPASTLRRPEPPRSTCSARPASRLPTSTAVTWPGRTCSRSPPAYSNPPLSRRPVTDKSRWREFPNMISSQEGTEDRLPRAVLRLCRAACSFAVSAAGGASVAGASAAARASVRPCFGRRGSGGSRSLLGRASVARRTGAAGGA